MTTYSLSHLSDQALLRRLASDMNRDRGITAELLASIAEVDARRLYLPAAYPSMFAYCVNELHLSEDSALKRIRAARTAREFPVLFAAVAEGRLHLTAVVMLKPFLTAENVDELVAAAAHKSKSEIELLLATLEQSAPGRVATPATELPVPGPVEQSVPGRIEARVQRPRVAPLAPRRFALQLTMSQEMHDRLRYAQALLGHQIPSGDVVEVLDRALHALIRELEKSKLGATDRPRPNQRRSTAGGRHIPAAVRRAVWKRDGGQCTFVSESGQRCPARKFLEFDHIDEVARGGQATVERIRLRCRAHNQYGAECTFGTEFMNDKRQEAQRAAAAARVAAEALAIPREQ